MRRALVTLVAAAALVLTPTTAAVSATSAPPSPGASGIGDPYFPLDGNGGYDVSHYRIKVAYDPATDAIRATTTVRASALKSLSRFHLDLVGLTVDSLRVNGARASWTRTAHELIVTPKRALKKGHAFSVRVRYHGVPTLLDEPALGQAGWFQTADGAVVAGQPHVAATWFPVNDHPLDKATYTTAITVPRGLEALSNGYLASKRSRGQHTTWTWKETKPMASYLATATTGQFDLHSYQRAGISYVDAIDPVLFDHVKPRTGTRYALSGSGDSGYNRLTRTIAVPAAGGRLTFHVQRNTEPDWDFFAVEARPVGTGSWTTLPDLNGHTSQATGNSCPFWLTIHPFLGHYQSDDGADGCTPTGTTGAWNAATGASDGYETWSVDLSPYAGKQVQVALSVISDDVVSYPGVWVDDIVGPGGVGSTSFENDGNPTDGWTVPGAPTGSPGNSADWTFAASDTRPTVGDNARASLDREPEILAFLAGVLGRYPFKQAGGIVDDDPGLGFALENQTRPIYSKAFFELEPNSGVVIHELTHQWTGDDLALGRWQDIWLNEGFATYLEWLWAEHEGDFTPQDVYDFYAGLPADDGFWSLAIGDPGPDRLFAGPVYDRGGLTLQALRLKIGDAKFFRLVKRWTAKYAGGNVTTPQFIALAEKVSGRQLDAFFQQWLYTAAKPSSLQAPATLKKSQASSSMAERLKEVARLRP
jgi:hypothetical protein